MQRVIPYLLLIFGLAACHSPEPTYVITAGGDTVANNGRDTLPSALPDSAGLFTKVDVGNLKPLELVSFAQKLKGIPYKYASTDPTQGFDCSGFITYVFNHFGIIVPRRSFDFLHVKRDVDINTAKPGDLILFTGTDETDRDVGHMGIITFHSPDSTIFIHSTSGHNNKGVVETPLNEYYKKRYVKTVRIFAD